MKVTFNLDIFVTLWSIVQFLVFWSFMMPSYVTLQIILRVRVHISRSKKVQTPTSKTSKDDDEEDIFQWWQKTFGMVSKAKSTV